MELKELEQKDDMGILETLKTWLFEPDPDTDDPIEDSDNGYQRDYQTEDSIERINAFIIVAKPIHFEEVEELCKYIKQGRAVLLNTEKMVPEDKQRTIDFLSGVVMAKDGTIAKIYKNVYICAGRNIGIVEK